MNTWTHTPTHACTRTYYEPSDNTTITTSALPRHEAKTCHHRNKVGQIYSFLKCVLHLGLSFFPSENGRRSVTSFPPHSFCTRRKSRGNFFVTSFPVLCWSSPAALNSLSRPTHCSWPFAAGASPEARGGGDHLALRVRRCQ